LIGEVIKPVINTAKISDLFAFIEEAWGEDARSAGHCEIPIDAKERENTIELIIHHPEFTSDDIRVTFYDFKHDNEGLWHIGYINVGDRVVTGRITNVASACLTDVAAQLFKYYAMGTKFEMDVDLCSIDLEY